MNMVGLSQTETADTA